MKPIPEVIRKYVLKRDKYRCRYCGASVTSRTAHIHHLFPRYVTIPAYLQIPWIPRNNHPWNLLTLCRRCHSYAHTKHFDKSMIERFIEENKHKEIPKELQEFLRKLEVTR